VLSRFGRSLVRHGCRLARRRRDDRDLSGKKFINDPRNIVDEMLAGFVQTHRQDVRRLNGSRVVVALSAPPGKVGLVAGGGSGHEPALLGYVGVGLLDAVVVGEVFASPPAGEVLAAIEAVDSGEGVLLVIGNYAGDVLNFEIAIEAARAAGHRVVMQVVTDDVAEGGDVGSRRGLAGSFFVWKSAGAAAEEGAPLDEVRRVARKANAATRTMGVASSPATVPGSQKPLFTIADDQIEIGVGHGEPGLRRETMRPVDIIVDELVEHLVSARLKDGLGKEVATLVNGLGATPLIELYVAQRRLVENLDERGISVHRSFVGNYYTALEMAGLSIALMGLDDEMKGFIDAPAVSAHFHADARL
jgi:dihydroxyacetone kinase-like protein